MALSVGTELAALLLGAHGAEAGPRRAPGTPAAQPGAEALPGFADLLAAATAAEPGLATAPAVAPLPAAEALGPLPATRPTATMPAAMPWDALAAAAEAADGLAAPFQWPGNAQPAAPLLPETPANVDSTDGPNETDGPVAPAPDLAQMAPLPLPIPAPTAPIHASAYPAKIQEGIGFPLLAAGEAPVQPQAPVAALAAAPSPNAGDKPGLEKPNGADPRPALPAAGATAEPPDAAQSMAPTQPLVAMVVAPVQDGPQVLAPPAAPRPSETRRGDAAAAPARRAETQAESALPLPLQPIEATDPPPATMAWKDMPATPREADGKGTAPPSLAPVVDAERPAATPPAIVFEAQRPIESARPSAAASATPLVLRPHQVAEAGQQIVLRTSQAATEGVETISVDLRPPELGRVEVRLTFREGTVQVSMTAERAETYEAFRHDRASLEQQMQQAGLQLGGSGLDLQHGRLPPRDGGEPERRLAPTAELAAEDGGDDALPPLRPRSDSLIDLIA